MNAQASGAIVTGTVIVVEIRILPALDENRQRLLEEAPRLLMILRRSSSERKVGPAPLARLCFTPFKRKSMRKQGHASQSPTPGRRPVSQTLILTRHPETDRSQPPRAGGLRCVSFGPPFAPPFGSRDALLVFGQPNTYAVELLGRRPLRSSRQDSQRSVADHGQVCPAEGVDAILTRSHFSLRGFVLRSRRMGKALRWGVLGAVLGVFVWAGIYLLISFVPPRERVAREPRPSLPPGIAPSPADPGSPFASEAASDPLTETLVRIADVDFKNKNADEAINVVRLAESVVDQDNVLLKTIEHQLVPLRFARGNFSALRGLTMPGGRETEAQIKKRQDEETESMLQEVARFEFVEKIAQKIHDPLVRANALSQIEFTFNRALWSIER